MKEFIYSGPLSGVSLKGHGDIMLHPGAIVSLPEDHDYTRRLIKRGWLVEAGTGNREPETGNKKNPTKKEEVTVNAG